MPGEQQQGPSGLRLSSSLSSGLNVVQDSAASAGGSGLGSSHPRDSIGGAEDLRDSSQGTSFGLGSGAAAALSQGGAVNLRSSITDQSDASSVSSVSVSGHTQGSLSGAEQQGMPVTVASSSASLGGLTAVTPGAGAGFSTPSGAGPRAGAAPGPGFLANWSSGGALNPAAGSAPGFGGGSEQLGAAGLNLSAYYASRPTAPGLLGGHRGSGVAAALREDAAWGIGRNSPRATREPSSPVLRGLVTRPELALCLLTEVRRCAWEVAQSCEGPLRPAALPPFPTA